MNWSERFGLTVLVVLWSVLLVYLVLAALQ
jgi:hypothetical protein